MKYTAAQKRLLSESDEEERRLSRNLSSEEYDSLIKMAHHYLRSDDPKIQTLIFPLWELVREKGEYAEEARETIRIWAQHNKIPNAQELHDRFGAHSPAGVRPHTLQGWMAHYYYKPYAMEDRGRGGIDENAIIYESPAGGFLWLYYMSEGDIDGQGNPVPTYFNHGTIDEPDLQEAVNQGLIDYFAEMAY